MNFPGAAGTAAALPTADRTPPCFYSSGDGLFQPDMDVLPMCSIFQELQIVHETGYFSALPSLEEYWQQVNRDFRGPGAPVRRAGSTCMHPQDGVCLEVQFFFIFFFFFFLFLMVWVNFLKKIRIVIVKTYLWLRRRRHFKGAFQSVERSCHLSGAQRRRALPVFLPFSGAAEPYSRASTQLRGLISALALGRSLVLVPAPGSPQLDLVI